MTPEAAARRLQAVSGLETVYLAEVGGEVAGFCSVRIQPFLSEDSPYAELTELYVDPAFRRRGVARALIRRAEELARRRGARHLVVLTGHDNAPAQHLYRNVGFTDYAVALWKRLSGTG